MDFNMSKEFSQLKQFLINSGRDYDIGMINRAFAYAMELHEGQYRKSGEEYISHPLAVAQICANYGYDTYCVCAALLHDVVEDCPELTNIKDVNNLFGRRVASLVDGLTKLKGMKFHTKEEENIQNLRNLRKMFIAMSEDLGVMFVKLCDRLHNMRTISSMTPEKQRIISLETMHVFAPVAHRLGMNKIRNELEDLSLQCLDPILYDEVKENVERKFGESRDCLEATQDKIKARLNMHGIRFTAEGRVKTVPGVFRKIVMKGKALSEVYDFYAIRYIVKEYYEVYSVLGIVHELFNHVPNRFKDYVSVPKSNGYQSIHTTVINDNGIPLEIQIRTEEMHAEAEFGVAAHWQYKSEEEASKEETERLKWLKSMVESGEDTNDPDEFLSSVKIGLYTDEIFIYTPKGDVKALPKGSTVIDFAYAIHSDVGNKMTGAKIDDVIAPIDRELETGQIVQILTSNSPKGPNRNWLDIVKTGEAKNKIRQWFKKEKRAENILVGIEETERIFKQFSKDFSEEQEQTILINVSKREGFENVEDFYNAIGYGGLSVSKITFKIREEVEKIVKEEEGDPILKVKPVKPYSDNTIIIVDGMDNCAIKLSKCCNPLPGDAICGFITKGHGLSVHKANCQNYINLKQAEELAGNTNRLIPVFWNSGNINKKENHAGQNFVSLLKIYAMPNPRLFSAITNLLEDMKVSVHSIKIVKERTDGSIILDLLISAKDVEHLNYIINKIKTIKNITGAGRLG